MGDMITDGMTFLEEQREAHMSRAVLYGRNGRSVTVDYATIGRVDNDQIEAAAGSLRFTWVDWLIKSTAIAMDGQTIIPKRGDTIRDTVNGIVRVYELADMGDQPCCQPSDASTWRLHTKLREGDDDA